MATTSVYTVSDGEPFEVEESREEVIERMRVTLRTGDPVVELTVFGKPALFVAAHITVVI